MTHKTLQSSPFVFHAIFPCIVLFFMTEKRFCFLQIVCWNLKTTTHRAKLFWIVCSSLTFFINYLLGIYETVHCAQNRGSDSPGHVTPHSASVSAAEHHCFRWYVVTFITTQPDIIVGRWCQTSTTNSLGLLISQTPKSLKRSFIKHTQQIIRMVDILMVIWLVNFILLYSTISAK